MATEAQIRANQANASRSSEPRTAEGQSRSRLNAVRHGMAGESTEFEAMASSEFLKRHDKWAEEFAPVGEGAEWALDRAVAASLRIERCERAVEDIQVGSSERAKLAWDQDRAVEAAKVFNQLERDPVLASRQLQTSYAGVVLLIEAWLGLASTLQTGDWSETEVSRALDLLGVSLHCRSARTVVDDLEGGDPAAYRRRLTFEEIERLEVLRDQALSPLEEMEQRQAMAGRHCLAVKAGSTGAPLRARRLEAVSRVDPPGPGFGEGRGSGADRLAGRRGRGAAGPGDGTSQGGRGGSRSADRKGASRVAGDGRADPGDVRRSA